MRQRWKRPELCFGQATTGRAWGPRSSCRGSLNDHAVGSPASILNTAAAIEAGITYIGNLAQQSYGYPGWSNDVKQMANTVVAMGMLAEKKRDGVVLDSYIDDGYCASFHDAATSLGWCLFHHYVARDLIGVAHSPSYGSSFADPVLKAAFGLALDAVNVERVPPSLVHGDTNSLRPEDSPDRSAATVATDVFFTVARELTFPTGAAVHATPLSEPASNSRRRRTSSSRSRSGTRPNGAHENRSTSSTGDRRKSSQSGSSSVVSACSSSCSRAWCRLVLTARDPLQLAVATRRLGAARIEELYGVGEPDSAYPRGFVPVAETDTLRRLVRHSRDELEALAANGTPPDLRG